MATSTRGRRSPRSAKARGKTKRETVGVIGLGIMGSAMSANLVRAGFRVVGYDPVPEAGRRLKRAGGTPLQDARGVADAAATIITSLPSASALIQVASELAQFGRKVIVIETSTLPIDVKEQARAALARRGAILLDCPLSGTGAQARTKDIAVYASGDNATYRAVVPVLEAFSRVNYYVGPFGNGSKMKFAANLLVAIHNVAAAEAMLLAERAGLDLNQVIEMIAPGAGGSRMFQMRAPMMASRSYEPATMRISTWKKDMAIIAEFASELGCETPLFTMTQPVYTEAMAMGLGNQDTAAVFEVLKANGT